MVQPLNKQQLYELVWEVPMLELARRYGLSDRGLAKICERNGIPVPPRGYWARKRAGAKITIPPLLVLDNERADVTVLNHSSYKEAQTTPIADDQSPPDDVQRAIERESLPTYKITVPKTLNNPHLIVARWIHQEEQQATSYRKYGDPYYKPEPLGEIDKRRRRIINALLKALESRGFSVEADRTYSQFIRVRYERDETGFTVTERTRHYRRALTPEEKKNYWNANTKWRRVSEPTGLLMIKISSQFRGDSWNARDFHESAEHPLENQLNSVIAGFIEKLWSIKKKRLIGEQEEQLRWQRQKEALRQGELLKAEQERKAMLVTKASNWRKASEVRAYVTAVIKAYQEKCLDIDERILISWKEWALAHAEELDPISSNQPLIDLSIDGKCS